MSSVEEMKEGLRERLAKAIRRQQNSGATAMSADNLWQVTDLRGWDGPIGVNCAWMARELFNEVVSERRFKSFVITEEYYARAKKFAAERREAVAAFNKEFGLPPIV